MAGFSDVELTGAARLADIGVTVGSVLTLVISPPAYTDMFKGLDSEVVVSGLRGVSANLQGSQGQC